MLQFPLFLRRKCIIEETILPTIVRTNPSFGIGNQNQGPISARTLQYPGVNRVWLGLGSRCLLARNIVVKIMSKLCDIEINTDQSNFKIILLKG